VAVEHADRDESRLLVLELTEREPVDDYGALARVLERFGNVQLAVGDAGLVLGTLVAGINHFAMLTNCHIIAEGVETDVRCGALRRLGIDFGQGFLSATPSRSSG